MDGHGQNNNPARFHQWWQGNQPIWTASGTRYTRQFVVLATANNQDAHVDEKLDAGYHAMMRDNLGMTFAPNFPDGTQGFSAPVPGDVARGSVRQIAW